MSKKRIGTLLLLATPLISLALASPGCKKKVKDEDKQSSEPKGSMEPKGNMDPMDPMDPMEAMDTMDAMEGGKEGDAKLEEQQESKRLAECKVIYEKHYKAFRPQLEKLGIQASEDELVKAYKIDDPGRLKRCASLTDEQIQCIKKQPNPIRSRAACEHKTHLALSAPSKWSAKITPAPRELTPKEAKRMQAWLKGKWVNENKKWKRKEVLTIAKTGDAKAQKFKDGKPEGKVEEYNFSFKNHNEIHRKWGTTTQTFTFLKLKPKAFVMSSNLLYNVIPVKDRKSFKLKIGHDTVAVIKDGKCEVFDLDDAATYPATCKWGRDPKEKKAIFTLSYKPGKYERKFKYFRIGKHLVHQYLYKNEFVKK